MKYKLQELLKFKTQGVNTTTDKVKYTDKGYKIVQAKNIEQYNITFDEKNFIDEETFFRIKDNHKLHKGDVLFTNIGSQLGNCAIYDLEEKAIITWNVMKLIPDEKIILKEYLCYLLNYNSKKIKLLNSSSTMPFVSGKELMNCEFEIPDVETQKKNVNILNSINKKIELNNQINESLLGIIRNYYKEMIVNNSDFILKKMDELIERTIGGDWGKEESTGNYNSEVLCIRGADIPEMDCGKTGKAPTRFILEKNLINKQLNGNEIIIEISGGSPTQSTGRCAYITNELKKSFDKPLICTNFCRAIKLKDDKYLPIFYMRLKELYSKNIMFLYENGTTGIKNLDLSSLLENEELSIISDEDINKFNELFYTINKKIVKKAHENRNLEMLRDTLLPKLMNGEIDLDKIEI